ncbi:MAG: hypothetical protein Kow0069_34150 [Promethearchaeota archaeon]
MICTNSNELVEPKNPLRRAFFGKKTAAFFNSGTDDSDYWYLSFIQVKPDGSWERLKEGKTVKMNLGELVAFLDVFEGRLPEWTTFHGYEGQKTHISASIQTPAPLDKFTVLLRVGGYIRPISYPETRIFRDLLKITYRRKLERADSLGTTPPPSPHFLPSPTDPPARPAPATRGESTGVATSSARRAGAPDDEAARFVRGRVLKETERALLLSLDGGVEQVWFPKAALDELPGDLSEGTELVARVAGWFLKKRSIQSFVP